MADGPLKRQSVLEFARGGTGAFQNPKEQLCNIESNRLQRLSIRSGARMFLNVIRSEWL